MMDAATKEQRRYEITLALMTQGYSVPYSSQHADELLAALAKAANGIATLTFNEWYRVGRGPDPATDGAALVARDDAGAAYEVLLPSETLADLSRHFSAPKPPAPPADLVAAVRELLDVYSSLVLWDPNSVRGARWDEFGKLGRRVIALLPDAAP